MYFVLLLDFFLNYKCPLYTVNLRSGVSAKERAHVSFALCSLSRGSRIIKKEGTPNFSRELPSGYFIFWNEVQFELLH